MEDLFRDYWWLIFPVGWLIGGAFNSAMNYRRDRDTIALIKAYADKGKEPPKELLNAMSDRDDEGHFRPRRERRYRNGGWAQNGSAFSVVFFGIMAAGFAYASFRNIFEAGDAFFLVSVVLSALALASLVSLVLTGDRRGRLDRDLRDRDRSDRL